MHDSNVAMRGTCRSQRCTPRATQQLSHATQSGRTNGTGPLEASIVVPTKCSRALSHFSYQSQCSRSVPRRRRPVGPSTHASFGPSTAVTRRSSEIRWSFLLPPERLALGSASLWTADRRYSMYSVPWLQQFSPVLSCGLEASCSSTCRRSLRISASRNVGDLQSFQKNRGPEPEV